MNPPRLNWRLAILLSLISVSVIGIAVLLYVPVNSELASARKHYATASTSLAQTTEQRDVLDEQFQLLQTHVDSVEYRARLEYRMIKPGEQLLLIRREE